MLKQTFLNVNNNTLKPVSFKVLLLLLFISNNSIAQSNNVFYNHKDSTNHILSVGFLPGTFGLYSSSVGFAYLNIGGYLEYSMFLTKNIQLSAGAVYYNSQSIFGNFDKKHQYLGSILGRYYLNRIHFDVGLKGGNYIEFPNSDSLNSQPEISHPKNMFYANIGIGMSFKLKEKLVFDVSYGYLYTLNNNFGIKAKNPTELKLSLGYIFKGTNKRFSKRLNRKKINEILKKDVSYLYASISPSAFISESKQIIDLNLVITAGARYFVSDKISLGLDLIPSMFYSKNDSIYIGNNGYLPRKLNTFDFNLSASYHWKFLYFGFASRIGSYSNYTDWTDFNRKINLKFGPEFGFYVRLNNKWLLDFRKTFYLSLPKLIDSNSSKAHFFSAQLYIIKIIDF